MVRITSPIIRNAGLCGLPENGTATAGEITSGAMRHWFWNVYQAVLTVGKALWVSLRYWLRTYDPRQRTFTEQYEYPELPARIYPRFRGFHRYDLTSCIACERCARRLPGGLHLHRQGTCGGA